jgi:hypothetical protein
MQELKMVLPPQRLNAEAVARVVAQSTKRTDGEAKAVAAYEATTLRMWCIERAVEAVGTEGVRWKSEGAYQPKETPLPEVTSAIVPVAQEILNFVLASPN